MIPHPYERFLGVDPEADAYTLLGLDPDRAEPMLVDEALHRRLAEIFRHPDARSFEAEETRDALRAAAATIKQQLVAERVSERMHERAERAGGADNPAWMSGAVRHRNRPRRARPVTFNLTAFDRLVLSALVGCGGWNAASRGQLVALAQNYGVSVEGLLRVMHGLSDYARSGGPRLGAREIAGGKPLPERIPLPALSSGAAPPVGEALLDRLADNLGHELRRGGAWPTIKLSILFGIVTLVVAIIALRLMFRGESRSSETEPVAEQPSVAPTINRPVAAVPASGDSGPARFAQPPTFLGNGLPAEAVDAVDRSPALPEQIDELGRKIMVADGEPSDAVYHQWEFSINTIAASWVIGERSTRAAIEQSIFETLHTASDTPAVSDRLLKALTPPLSLGTPMDLWRGTWMTGMLAQIASTSSMPPVVVDRARGQLKVALPEDARDNESFHAAADRWLGLRLPQLVSMLPFDEHAYDFWELWISAERALGEGDRLDLAITTALHAILITDNDLSHPGAPVNVAARLFGLSLQSGSAVARQRILALFDDEQVAARDLWVLTSLLMHSEYAPWFSDNLLAPDDADMAHRFRIRDDLSKVWLEPPAPSPAQEQGGPQVDEADAQAWAEFVDSRRAAPPGDDQIAIVQQVIDASRLVEAAQALVEQVPEEARRLMARVEEGWTAIPGPRAPPLAPGAPPQPGGKPRVGQALGQDGVWTVEYGKLGKNAQARVESMRNLGSVAGTDLGPIDAALLVHEACRGTPTEVRVEAQGLISQHFTSGPNVAMQLLDQFPETPAVESISEMIQTVTGRTLPAVRSSAWANEARLALVQHMLELREQGEAPVDELLGELIESYTGRLALLSRNAKASAAPTSPHEAGAWLVRGLLERAEFASPSQPTPADLPNLQRRHATRQTLADGPIQSFVVQQLAILDVTVYHTVAEQPALRDRALEIMHEHAAARARMASVLEQSLDVERTVLDIWRLRLGFDPKQPRKESA